MVGWRRRLEKISLFAQSDLIAGKRNRTLHCDRMWQTKPTVCQAYSKCIWWESAVYTRNENPNSSSTKPSLCLTPRALTRNPNFYTQTRIQRAYKSLKTCWEKSLNWSLGTFEPTYLIWRAVKSGYKPLKVDKWIPRSFSRDFAELCLSALCFPRRCSAERAAPPRLHRAEDWHSFLTANFHPSKKFAAGNMSVRR